MSALGIAGAVMFTLGIVMILARNKIQTWRRNLIKSGGVLSALPLSVTGTTMSETAKTKVEVYLVSGMTIFLMVFILYLLYKFCEWCWRNKGGFRKSILVEYDNHMPESKILLELYTSDSHATMVVTTYRIPPDRILLTYYPSDIRVQPAGQFGFYYLDVSYGRLDVHLDETHTTFKLPRRLNLPLWQSKKILKMARDTTLTSRMTLLCGTINYTECIIALTDTRPNDPSPFKRAAKYRDSVRIARKRLGDENADNQESELMSVESNE